MQQLDSRHEQIGLPTDDKGFIAHAHCTRTLRTHFDKVQEHTQRRQLSTQRLAQGCWLPSALSSWLGLLVALVPAFDYDALRSLCQP